MMNNSTIKKIPKPNSLKKPIIEDYILDFGQSEKSIPVQYSPKHQQRAENSMILRNWIREEEISLEDVKGFYLTKNAQNSIEEFLSIGFLAFLFELQDDYITINDYKDLTHTIIDTKSRKFSILEIIHKSARCEYSKIENFFIHEWEGSKWFSEWSAIDVDWSDWISGPKYR
jgi:hypothetical protein